MISQEEFIKKWREEEPLYIAWGRFIVERLNELIDERIKPKGTDVFLRLPVSPRIKAQESLLQKAYFRQKDYKNPYEEIEDKVGVRFVVLLSNDVRIIEEAILVGDKFWDCEKARDYEEERNAKPEEFGYQSVHYVLKSKYGNRHSDLELPEGLPCEVQVRTLLQHAYSELTHDTIYKPSIKATPKMKRAAAKSMALIEATDDYFTQVSDLITEITEATSKVEEVINFEFANRISAGGNSAMSPLNSLLVDHYSKFITEGFQSDLSDFLNAKTYVIDRIKERIEKSALYTVPAILLLYYCVWKNHNEAKNDAPLDEEELGLIYSDLGLSLSTN